jgi:divalent metal cation (Fe/Co/Zn/Cd) transporter
VSLLWMSGDGVATQDLLADHTAGTSTLGLAVTTASLLLMPALGVAKKRLGATLSSGATAGEGIQNLICAAQAAAVLIGLAATGAYGWTWIDPAIALLLAAWAVKEGINAWNGEDCC